MTREEFVAFVRELAASGAARVRCDDPSLGHFEVEFVRPVSAHGAVLAADPTPPGDGVERAQMLRELQRSAIGLGEPEAVEP